MTDTPLLSISCPRCGRQWRHLADWHNHNRPPPCPACGGRLHVIRLRPRTVEECERAISKPFVCRGSYDTMHEPEH
jgi:NAD-dependent SIR2 family protein deacetylase